MFPLCTPALIKFDWYCKGKERRRRRRRKEGDADGEGEGGGEGGVEKGEVTLFCTMDASYLGQLTHLRVWFLSAMSVCIEFDFDNYQ